MIDLSGLWPHQLESYNFGKDLDSMVDGSDPGCVDAETEYLTPTGWKYISDYIDGDLIANIYPDTLNIEFEKPIDYIEAGSASMIYFNPSRGLNMMLSAEHRVLYYSKSTDDLSNWKVTDARSYSKLARFTRIAACFNPPDRQGLDISLEVLRVQVAVIADGYFASNTNRVILRLKKERKKERLRALLAEANIEYKESVFNEKIKGFTVFSFVAPFKDKHYDAKYWGCSKEQLEIIADECLYWDGDCKKIFFTTIKDSADFIQYAFSSCGYVSTVTTFVRKETDRKRPIEYNVLRRETKGYLVGGIRQESVSFNVYPKKGKKYCFTTRTSFWLARRNGHIFATGNSGKTFAHVKIIENFLSNGGSRAVVTCPKTLVRSAWLQEFTTRLPDINIALAEAPSDNRKAAFDSGAEVVVINVDGFKWLASQDQRWLKKRLGSKAMLINDESHVLKNPQAQRTKAALKIAPLFKKRHVMSGTMCPNSITEIWSQLKIVDDGARLGKIFNRFRNIMQVPVRKGPFVEWVDRDDAAEMTYGMIGDITIRHKFEDVMKHVPDMSQHIVWYELPNKHMSLYKQLEEDSYIEHKGQFISAVNAAALAGKLLQCASGAAYNDGGESWSMIDSGRYELIADLVEGRQHSIIFFLWKHQKAELIKILKARKISFDFMDGSVSSSSKREEIVNKMQDGKLQCLLMHPSTGSYGLTLTKSTSVIYASPVYEAMKKVQGDARIRRGVQDKATESIVILAKDTRDIHAYEVFTGKKNRLEALNNLFEGN